MPRKEKVKSGAEFMAHARKELKKLQKCDFEEFKKQMILLLQDIYGTQVMVVEDFCSDRKILMEGIEATNKVLTKEIEANNKDFATGERNFKKTENELDRIRAGCIVNFMRIDSLVTQLFKNGLIQPDQAICILQLKSVSKEALKTLSNLFDMPQKMLREVTHKKTEMATA